MMNSSIENKSPGNAFFRETDVIEEMPVFGTAAILAGGKSSRMGFDKQLLMENDKRILEQVIETLKEEFSDVKFVVYGPFDAPIYKVKNIYRKRFIIKYKNNPRSRALLDKLLTEESASYKTSVKTTLDIGPGLI